MDHTDYGRHVNYAAMFRSSFWVILVLSVPVVFFGNMVRMWLRVIRHPHRPVFIVRRTLSGLARRLAPAAASRSGHNRRKSSAPVGHHDNSKGDVYGLPPLCICAKGLGHEAHVAVPGRRVRGRGTRYLGDPKYAQDRLGHSDISVTLNTYTHVLPDVWAGVARKIEGALLS